MGALAPAAGAVLGRFGRRAANTDARETMPQATATLGKTVIDGGLAKDSGASAAQAASHDSSLGGGSAFSHCQHRCALRPLRVPQAGQAHR
ncbi:MAG TPA: hypothetical protein VMU47_23425 [Caldimonas sp.]|nr:hypothetical protein [Caldimonas sp.]